MKVGNQLETFNSYLQPDVLLPVPKLTHIHDLLKREEFPTFTYTPCLLCSYDLQWYTTN
jgi:hypothetical protein